MDKELLTPGPDLSSVDFTKLDRGDNVPGAAAPADDAAAQAAQAEEAEEADEAGAEAESKASEARTRDEKGRFAEKPADDKASDGKGQRIPKARFDEAVGKEREQRQQAERRAQELERRLAELEQGQQVAKAVADEAKELEKKLDDLERQRDELLLDGNADKAAEVRRQIREANRQLARLESQEASTSVISEQLEAQRLDATIARIESDFPVFNPTSEHYDADLTSMVLILQSDLIKRNYSPSLAMAEAARVIVEKVEKLRGPAPAAAEKPAEKGLAEAKGQVADRSAKALEQALAADKRQPPNMRIGLDSDKLGEKGGLPDPNKMSVEEFAALPEATRARLRGDTL